MFTGKARSPPLSGVPERCITWVGSGLTCKHYTRLERLARHKHSSLLRKLVNYARKKFYSIGPRTTVANDETAATTTTIFRLRNFVARHRSICSSPLKMRWLCGSIRTKLAPFCHKKLNALAYCNFATGACFKIPLHIFLKKRMRSLRLKSKCTSLLLFCHSF